MGLRVAVDSRGGEGSEGRRRSSGGGEDNNGSGRRNGDTIATGCANAEILSRRRHAADGEVKGDWGKNALSWGRNQTSAGAAEKM